MQGLVEVKEYGSAAEMIAAAAAVHERLFRPKPKLPVVAEVVSLFPERAWSTQHDFHVVAWRVATYKAKIKSLEMSLRNRDRLIERMIGDGCTQELPRISAIDVCRTALAECTAAGEGDFSMAEILGNRRGREVVNVRHKCMAAVVQNCHHLSYPQIGRFFNRDHSTIIFAAKKMGAAR